MTRILAISGSLRQDSLNTAALRAAITHAPEGVAVELLDPAELKALEPYDQDDDHDSPPAHAVALRDRLTAADVVLIATPEYNGTVPGQLKHLIDWGSRPFGAGALKDKPVAVISTSPSDYGALWAGEAVRKSLGIAGTRVIKEIDLAIGGAAAKFDDSGVLIDQELIEQLTAVLNQLAEHHRALVG
jgi:NAD(P)H-dependent FMN reductase